MTGLPGCFEGDNKLLPWSQRREEGLVNSKLPHCQVKAIFKPLKRCDRCENVDRAQKEMTEIKQE